MKRILLAMSVAAATLLALTAGAARADADHFSFSYTIGPQVFPAGTLCDFNFESSTIGFQIETDVSNGRIVAHGTQHNTHTNLDTGYSLTEVDQVTSTFFLSSPTTLSTGIFWHLRDASGNNVLVKAGEATFDASTFELISFTPNSGFDQTFAQILCPLLGGSPA
jgi:hypothetical protein